MYRLYIYIFTYIYVFYLHIVILYMLFPSAHLQSPAQVSFVCIAFCSRKSVANFRPTEYQGCLDKLQIACINSPACSPEHEREAGFYGFHGDIQKDVFFCQTNWGGEISWSNFFLVFFFRLLLYSGPVKHGEQEFRDFQKTPKGSVLFLNSRCQFVAMDSPNWIC